ncbi:MAG: hypothetical protein Q4Q62_00330 [Thermoplasmata archaeon]|nr:hypothetical protein [Thermoplasmata archaeon]
MSPAKCFMYCLASRPVMMQHSTVPSLTPPSVPRPIRPMTAAMMTMELSDATRTLP